METKTSLYREPGSVSANFSDKGANQPDKGQVTKTGTRLKPKRLFFRSKLGPLCPFRDSCATPFALWIWDGLQFPIPWDYFLADSRVGPGIRRYSVGWTSETIICFTSIAMMLHFLEVDYSSVPTISPVNAQRCWKPRSMIELPISIGFLSYAHLIQTSVFSAKRQVLPE